MAGRVSPQQRGGSERRQPTAPGRQHPTAQSRFQRSLEGVMAPVKIILPTLHVFEASLLKIRTQKEMKRYERFPSVTADAAQRTLLNWQLLKSSTAPPAPLNQASTRQRVGEHLDPAVRLGKATCSTPITAPLAISRGLLLFRPLRHDPPRSAALHTNSPSEEVRGQLRLAFSSSSP